MARSETRGAWGTESRDGDAAFCSVLSLRLPWWRSTAWRRGRATRRRQQRTEPEQTRWQDKNALLPFPVGARLADRVGFTGTDLQSTDKDLWGFAPLPLPLIL
ncbi:hypothetical protein NDU88_007662 [Pleurodeles waltl]|uniref:Uncharacterized protein n=1 Tax=Pleurodeles waltl TaxID=8319 RepID=A0AAV7PLZ6_PLEWA|nr:hypothetical protein NDU88_007662 [Pleurodeles waltl]